tara:strand:+ start:364 stop:630 length:267 start_codon:yes stop_codon:yes gene_type:complete
MGNILEILLAFRDGWSRTNYPDFMALFFPDVEIDSVRYTDEYHMNRWEQFRDSPMIFFSHVDGEMRRKVCRLIEANYPSPRREILDFD